MRNLIRRWMPAGWREQWQQRFGWRWFRGQYGSWSEARAFSDGYDDAAVLARVVAATRAARAKSGAWERDGMVFQSPEQNQPLLGALATASAANAGCLEVVDFGGALGSLWWQHREALSALGLKRWIVVEQPHYVEAGREFANDVLAFVPTLAAAAGCGNAHVIVLSGVLQYVEYPAEVLADAARQGFVRIIIDRTSLVCAGDTRLAVQHTPPDLGGGSYPVWLFEEDDLLGSLHQDYEKVASWSSLDRLARDVKHKGFHFTRRP